MIKNELLINDLKESIIKCKEYITANNILGDYKWTEQIKSFIGRLGKSKGYKICASCSNEKFESEWLYDMVWYKEQENTGYLIEVPLVVESEWKQNLFDIKFDFEKLLLANSELKLMICNCKLKSKDELISYFKKAIEACPLVRSGDEFMIAILEMSGSDAEDFSFEVIMK